MNDNEIKRLIDAAADDPETGGTASEISAEEVKSLVMAKIGKENKKSAFEDTENIEYVEPTFVTSEQKHRPHFKIAAAAAAACVGIACAGGYFVLGGNGVDLSPDTEPDGTVYSSGSSTDSGADIILTENGNELPQSNGSTTVVEYTLLDGYKTTYYPEHSRTVTDEGDTVNILERRDGKLWFIGNGENIDIAEAAGGKSYYIYTYYNAGTESEHRVVVSNTDEILDCGYFEMYCSDKIGGRWQAHGRNCYTFDDPDQIMHSPIAEGYKQWVYDAIEDMGYIAFDQKVSERAGNGEDIDMEKTVYITGSALPIFTEDKYLTVHLLDGTEYEYNNYDNNYNIVHEDEFNNILEFRDQELYFTGNGENINIYEAAGDKPYYIYTYVNSDTETEHKIVIFNTDDPKECGYFELFYVDITKRWYAYGRRCHISLSSMLIDDYKPWVYEAVDELGLSLTRANESGKEISSTDVIFSGNIPPIFTDEFDPQADIEPAFMDRVDPLPAGYTLLEEFTLLDNTLVRIADKERTEAQNTFIYGIDNIELFSKENGRLYFIGNGEHEDITDILINGKSYVYSYIHPERNKTHYIVAGGFDADFGYVELFIKDEARNGWIVNGYNFLNDYDSDEDGFDMSHLKIWLLSVMGELKVSYCGGGGGEKDFSYLFTGINASPLETSYEEFNLLDNTYVNIYEDNISTGNNKDYVDIFSSENGRLYFIGNGEHEDITDTILGGETYVYAYIHPNRNKTHYIIAGGIGEEFGYAELFETGLPTMKWLYSGYNLSNYMDHLFESDYNYMANRSPWLVSALEEMDILYSFGSSEDVKDFSYLFSDLNG